MSKLSDRLNARRAELDVSTRAIADTATAAGFDMSHTTVARFRIPLGGLFCARVKSACSACSRGPWRFCGVSGLTRIRPDFGRLWAKCGQSVGKNRCRKRGRFAPHAGTRKRRPPGVNPRRAAFCSSHLPQRSDSHTNAGDDHIGTGAQNQA